MSINLGELRGKTVRPNLQTVAASVAGASKGIVADQATLCGAMIWASFSAPAAIPLVFDTQFAVLSLVNRLLVKR